MFRMLVLQALNNLSDEQVEYQVHDRLSFSRFLGLAIEDSIPDATTLWLFREKLARAGLIEQLVTASTSILRPRATWRVAGRSSTPVSPTQRNSRDENAELQAGRTLARWKQKPAKVRQKDRDARWTKKHGPQLLRLQEPCERGRQAQADPALCGDRMRPCTTARSWKGCWTRATPLHPAKGEVCPKPRRPLHSIAPGHSA